MSTSEQKVVQYLNEAHATERALVRVLQSQIAMAPSGSYRKALETHLRETRSHADRVQRRLRELRWGRSPIQFGLGLAEGLLGQGLAVAKLPLDALRGTGGEEKMLKNAKDACATEALEIATYAALERVASRVGDEDTADLAASIRADEERMLARIMRELPKLADAVVDAEVEGKGSYDVSDTGAAEAVREAGETVKDTARSTARKARGSARKVPGAARAEGQVRGAVAGPEDLPIARYEQLTAEEIAARLNELTQIELAMVIAYERGHENRTTVVERAQSLQGDEPWPGYDQLTAPEVQAALGEGDSERADAVRSYETRHKGRTTVLKAAEREHVG